MSQIDVLLQYATEAAALADPELAPYINGGAFDQSRVFVGVQIWNATADTTATVTGPQGQSVTVPAHAYQPGFALIISYADPTITPGQVNANAASIAPWKTNAACLLIADRDAANVGASGFIYYAASAISATLAQWRLAPTPLGASYPFGSP